MSENMTAGWPCELIVAEKLKHQTTNINAIISCYKIIITNQYLFVVYTVFLSAGKSSDSGDNQSCVVHFLTTCTHTNASTPE